MLLVWAGVEWLDCLQEIQGVHSRCTLRKDVDHLMTREDSSNWLVTPTETLSNGLDIWANSLLLPRVECP